MLNKALGTYTAVLLILVVFFTSLALVLASQMGTWMSEETDKYNCLEKFKGYCQEWFKKGYADDGKPYDWSKENPKNCDKYGMLEPTADKCKDLLNPTN